MDLSKLTSKELLDVNKNIEGEIIKRIKETKEFKEMNAGPASFSVSEISNVFDNKVIFVVTNKVTFLSHEEMVEFK